MTNELEIRMADPMTDGGLRTGEEVIEDGNFVAEEHQTIDQVGADEASTTGDKDALALRRRQELHGRETR